MVGWDFGLTPACVFAQISPRGQLLVLDELTSRDMGIRQFATNVVRPFIAANFGGLDLLSVGDPAGQQRAQTDERTCFDVLKELGLPTMPARSNAFMARREAVAGFLGRMVDGKPGFLLSPSCKALRKGFLGRYHYPRLMTSLAATYKDTPEKNEFSHVHDALQYAALLAEGGQAKRSGVAAKRRRHMPADAAGY